MDILILTTDAGGGHRSVANALAAGFAEAGGSGCHVEVVDYLARYAPFPLSHTHELYGFLMRFPVLYDAFFDATNTRRGRVMDTPAAALFMEVGIRRMLRDYSPDVIVATHPMASPALSGILHQRRETLPYYTVVTDYGALHTWWAFPFGELWFAPSEETAGELIRSGVSRRRVRVSGYPVNPRFEQPAPPKEELRRALGLEPQRFTALLVAGAEGVGPVEEIVAALAGSPAPWQLIVVCGRNEPLRSRLETRAWSIPLRIEGYVEDMPARMHAADVLLTKAGGCTLSEGLACGLPMLMINVLPGQEEGNAAHFSRLGAARRVSRPAEARHLLAELAAPDSKELRSMRAQVRQAAHPRAYLEVARCILERGTVATASPMPPLFGLHLLQTRSRRLRSEVRWRNWLR